jgi:hypothetical protein
VAGALVLTAILGLVLTIGVARHFQLGERLRTLIKGSAATPAASQAPAAVTAQPPPPAPSPQDVQELVAEVTAARFQGLVNVKGGRLLVITGEVRHGGRQPRGPIRLKAVLTDAQHQPVKERLFYAGTAFTDEEVMKLAPEAIDRWLDTPGGRSGNAVLRPGARQPFTVVLFGVPENLAAARYGYTVNVVAGPADPTTP